MITEKYFTSLYGFGGCHKIRDICMDLLFSLICIRFCTLNSVLVFLDEKRALNLKNFD